jgi:small subunit ribosomal protein S7
MKNGKKIKAANIISKSAKIIQEKTSSPFLEILDKALKNISPLLETKSRKFGGSNHRIPVKVEEKRSLTLAFR